MCALGFKGKTGASLFYIRSRSKKTAIADPSHCCHICSTPITKYNNSSYGKPANKIMFCSELCKAKSCITLGDNDCWIPRILVFTSNGRSYSVRAVLYEKAFNIRYEGRGMPSPSCGNRSCANPAHVSFKNVGKIITLKDL